jgi:alpha-L-fucosidase
MRNQPVDTYRLAEFTYPILEGQGRQKLRGAQWFYSLPENDRFCCSAEKIYLDYCGAVKYGNIFSLDVGPGRDGRLRAIDVATLQKVGQYIRGELTPPPTPSPPRSQYNSVQASSVWGIGYEAARACDGDFSTRWGAEEGARSGWLQRDLGQVSSVAGVFIDEAGYDRIQRYEIQVKQGDTWTTVAKGTTCGDQRKIDLDKSVEGQVFRLHIIRASETPTISEFQLLEK